MEAQQVDIGYNWGNAALVSYQDISEARNLTTSSADQISQLAGRARRLPPTRALLPKGVALMAMLRRQLKRSSYTSSC